MKSVRLAVSLAAFALFTSTASSAAINEIVVFGDSLSDGGNLYNLTGGAYPPAPLYDQRFSNGAVAVEYMASSLGLSLTVSTVGGSNYAVGGAATGNVSSPSGTYDSYLTYVAPQAFGGLNGFTGMDKQLAQYASSAPQGVADTLFVLWGGSNDLFINPSVATMSQAVMNLSSSITTLVGMGATQFLVPGMADWSLTPEGQSSSFEERAGMSALSAYFNGELSIALSNLQATYSDVDIRGFDTNALFQHVMANAAAYGFNYTATSCLADSCYLTPGLVDQYMFWDGVHPTARVNALMGGALGSTVAAVPEPSQSAMLLASMLPLAWVVRRARRNKHRA